MTMFCAKQAVAGGATVLFGGGVPSDTDANASGRKPGVGYYVPPTILAGAADGDEAWEAEIFGPVGVNILIQKYLYC